MLYLMFSDETRGFVNPSYDGGGAIELQRIRSDSNDLVDSFD